MDTSKGGHSLAAILDGRMGLVCDLRADIGETEPPPPRTSTNAPRSVVNNMGTLSFSQDFYTEKTSGSARNINIMHVHSDLQRSSLLSASKHAPRSTAMVTSREPRIPLEYAPECAPCTSSNDLPLPNNQGMSKVESNTTSTKGTTSFPVSSAPFSLYHALGYPNDPPRSVAVCESRQCIAWGCNGGVELHWVDVSSGRNKMKWWPVSCPSDYLYFLPARVEANSSRVRIFCSKGGPGQKKSSMNYSSSSSSWKGLESSIHGNPVSITQDDHFAAVPLNDGQHFLFTEPSTGFLTMGSDGSLPSPTEPGRFLRKISFIPPKNLATQVNSENPSFLYSATSDLSWGLRVVAVYGTTMVLYCVPPDIMTDMAKITGTTSSPIEEVAEQYTFSSWYACWDFGYSKAGETQWPIPLFGSIIDEVSGLVDICVQGSDTPTVWGFFTDGTAKTWELSHENTVGVLQRHVDFAGMVLGSIDKDGDCSMRDVGRPVAGVYINGTTKTQMAEVVLTGVLAGRPRAKFDGQYAIYDDERGKKCSRVERFLQF